MDWPFGMDALNADVVHSLDVLHHRAARIIYNLPRDVPTEEVYRHSNWNTYPLL